MKNRTYPAAGRQKWRFHVLVHSQMSPCSSGMQLQQVQQDKDVHRFMCMNVWRNSSLVALQGRIVSALPGSHQRFFPHLQLPTAPKQMRLCSWALPQSADMSSCTHRQISSEFLTAITHLNICSKPYSLPYSKELQATLVSHKHNAEHVCKPWPQIVCTKLSICMHCIIAALHVKGW